MNINEGLEDVNYCIVNFEEFTFQYKTSSCTACRISENEL